MSFLFAPPREFLLGRIIGAIEEGAETPFVDGDFLLCLPREFLLGRIICAEGSKVEEDCTPALGTSPFEGIAAAHQLTFTVDAAGFAVDPDTGVEISKSEEVLLSAYLSKKRKPEGTEVPGVNTTSIYMRGWLMSPLTIPDGIRSGMVAEYSYEPAWGCKTTGRFVFLAQPQSAFAEVQTELGDRIEGYLTL